MFGVARVRHRAATPSGIYELVATASAFGSAGIFVVGLFGLFSRVGGAPSAYAALVAGVVVWAAGEYWLEWSTPYVVALAARARRVSRGRASLARADVPRARSPTAAERAAFELRCRHASIKTWGMSSNRHRAAGLRRRPRRRDLALRDAVPSLKKRSRTLTPVTDAMLANPAPADWPMWRRTLNNWGYSPLEEIDRRNVAQLRLVWTRPLADGGYQEGTPLVHDGILFFPNPNDVTQAFERRDRRLPLGVSPQGARGRRRVLPGAPRPTAISRSTTT